MVSSEPGFNPRFDVLERHHEKPIVDQVGPIIVGAGPVPSAQDGVSAGTRIERELPHPKVFASTNDIAVAKVFVVPVATLPAEGIDPALDVGGTTAKHGIDGRQDRCFMRIELGARARRPSVRTFDPPSPTGPIIGQDRPKPAMWYGCTGEPGRIDGEPRAVQ